MRKTPVSIVFLKNRIICAVLVFFSLMFANSSSASETIRIGLSLGLTGKYSVMSDFQLKGFRLWERCINERGGLLGKKVQVIVYDDKSDPETSKKLYQHMIKKDKLDFVFGPYSSEITEAILPVTEAAGYPLLISGASSNRIWQMGYKYVFGVYTPASDYLTGFLEIAVMSGLDNIAVFHADDSSSREAALGAKKWAERFKLNVLLLEEFKKGKQDLDALAQKARDSKAQILIVCGHFDESINMRISMKRIGWHPRAYFASVGPTTSTYYDMLKTYADYTFSSSQWEHHGGLRPHGSNKFYNDFISVYNQEPSYHAATAFAAGEILEKAVGKAGRLDRAKIRSILSTMDTLSIIGRYGVDRTGMQINHFNLTVQWQNGKREVVWPEEIRTAKPIFK